MENLCNEPTMFIGLILLGVILAIYCIGLGLKETYLFLKVWKKKGYPNILYMESKHSFGFLVTTLGIIIPTICYLLGYFYKLIIC